MSALITELRKKYRTPKEAMAALGLDEKLLNSGHPHEKEPSMTKKVLTRFAGASVAALGVYLAPRLAADAKIDLKSMFEDVTKKNFGGRKAKIAADIKAAAKGKMAKDAKLEDLTQMLDHLEKEEVEEGADENPNSGLPMSKEEMDKAAKDKKAADRVAAKDAFRQSLSEDQRSAYDKMCAEDGESEEAEEDADGEDGEPEDKPFGGKDAEAPAMKPKTFDKKAMDSAIKTAVEESRKHLLDTQQAYADVEPWVGKLKIGMDSAPAVYRAALKGLGMDAKKVDAMHSDALKSVLEAQPKPGDDRKPRRIAEDASTSNSEGYSSRWGTNASRIGTA